MVEYLWGVSVQVTLMLRANSPGLSSIWDFWHLANITSLELPLLRELAFIKQKPNL